MTWINDVYYCIDCVYELFVICNYCGEYVPNEDAITDNRGYSYCCYRHAERRDAYQCERCSELYHIDYLTNVEDFGTVCQYCLENMEEVRQCDYCMAVYASHEGVEDDGFWYCDEQCLRRHMKYRTP